MSRTKCSSDCASSGSELKRCSNGPSFLYRVYTFLWISWRGFTDGFGNSIENLTCHLYRHRRRAQLPESLSGKTVVITGGNTGIGKETALTCARLGARVIIACRTNATEAVQDILTRTKSKKENVTSVHVDLSSLSSVRNCASEILDLTEQIDILINNAGIMMCPEWKTKDGYEYQFGTNYLGHFLFTILLLPKLKAAPSARIVNVASLASFTGAIHWENLNLQGIYSPLRAYSQSKVAQMLFNYELARRFKETATPITVYALHPGIVRTGITAYFNCCLQVLKWTFQWMVMISPELGSQTTLHCALSEEAGRESGFYYE